MRSDLQQTADEEPNPAVVTASAEVDDDDDDDDDNDDDDNDNNVSPPSALPASPRPRVPASASAPAAAAAGGAWTIPLLCAGLGLIACCVLIPQADANRRLAYERRMLEMDLQSVKQQVAMNDIFLRRVSDDPTLAERLAQRQMKIIRAGTRVLPLDGDRGAGDMSPFQIVSVAPPAPLPPYRPVGGALASLCYNPRSRLYLTGVALLLVAGGLVLGGVRL